MLSVMLNKSEGFLARLVAAEKAITSLLDAFSMPEGPGFPHPMPPAKSSGHYKTASIICEIEDDLLRLDSIMSIIDRVKVGLYHRKIRAVNLSRPITLLPPEILAYTFSLVVEAASSRDKGDAVLTLSHVSSLWRDVIISQSRQWVHISAQWPHERQDAWLERSKARPLHLTSWGAAYTISSRMRSSTNSLQTIIARNLYEDLFPLSDIFDHAGFSGLQHIELDCDNCAFIVDCWILELPNLRVVRLAGLSFSDSLQEVTEIPTRPWTELCVDTCIVPVGWLLKLVSACGDLCRLQIDDISCTDADVENARLLRPGGVVPPPLPLLTQLAVGVEHPDRILPFLVQSISTPNLASFAIYIYDNSPQGNRWPHPSFPLISSIL